MRVVIDLQGAQGSSRNRGIGRASLALARAMARNRGDHELLIALNGRFVQSIEVMRGLFRKLLPPENVVVWGVPNLFMPDWRERRAALEHFFETAVAGFEPDFLLITSFFEGEGATTSIGQSRSTVPTAVLLHDLIPLIHPKLYLREPSDRFFYASKIKQLRQADLFLAVSESARQEAVAHLGADDETSVSILLASEGHFSPGVLKAETHKRLAERYNLVRPFVMYTGGFDARKNLDRLIAAYAEIPAAVRKQHQLAIVCSLSDAERGHLRKRAAKAGLGEDELVLTGFIPEEDLLACYRACKLFVFPSWHEGFGLPALEAMMCGKAVIAGNLSSLPEVVGNEDALFDPFDVPAMAAKMTEVLTDGELRAALEKHGLERAKTFNWDDTARRAWAALEASHARLSGQPRAARKRARSARATAG